MFGNSEAQLDEQITNFQNTVKNRHKEKKRIIAFCEEKMAAAERTAERESIVKIDEYKKREKHMFRDLGDKRNNMAD